MHTEKLYARSNLELELDQYEDLLYDDPHEAVRSYREILNKTSPTKDLNLWLRATIKHAIHLAQRMQEKFIELYQQWELTENQHFEMHIGIHQGQAVVGSFGGNKRSDYTVVGNSVNIAARVEGLAEPNSILATEAVIRYLPDTAFGLRGHFRIRGLNKEMPLFHILQATESQSMEDPQYYKIPV